MHAVVSLHPPRSASVERRSSSKERCLNAWRRVGLEGLFAIGRAQGSGPRRRSPWAWRLFFYACPSLELDLWHGDANDGRCVWASPSPPPTHAVSDPKEGGRLKGGSSIHPTVAPPFFPFKIFHGSDQPVHRLLPTWDQDGPGRTGSRRLLQRLVGPLPGRSQAHDARVGTRLGGWEVRPRAWSCRRAHVPTHLTPS